MCLGIWTRGVGRFGGLLRRERLLWGCGGFWAPLGFVFGVIMTRACSFLWPVAIVIVKLETFDVEVEVKAQGYNWSDWSVLHDRQG